MPLRRKGFLAAGLCLALAGCTEFPEIAKVEGVAGPVPALLPLDGLLLEAETETAADPAPDLARRAAALRLRAATIGAP